MFDVVVIGSGVAGLQAARSLIEDFGITNIVVLEADARVGGRVWADRTIFPGVELCLGAEIVHGTNTLITRMGRKLGWQFELGFTWAHGDGGPSETEAPDGTAGYYYIGSEKRLVRFSEVSEAQTRMQDALFAIQSLSDKDLATTYGGWTLRQYLESKGVTEPYLDMACAGYANTVAGTLDLLTIAGAARQERLWNNDGDGDMALHPSTQLIVDTLKAGVPIRTGCVVSKVTVHALDKCVEVVTTDGAVIRASNVIVAVPPPALRDGDISFTPALSPEKQAAFKRVKFSNGAKLFLQFSRKFWPEDCAGMICCQTKVPEMWFKSDKITGPDGKLVDTHVVTCFFMSDRADFISSLPESEAIRVCLDEVCEIFGPEARRSFVAGKRMSWGHMRFIRGGYTCMSTAELPSDRAIIAAPHADRVFFAGEAYSPAYDLSPMTLQGAMGTGLEAAKQAVKSMLANRPARL